MNVNDSLVKILFTLNEFEVKHMVVGGTAVGYYGYIRLSTAKNGEHIDEPDLDIWYNPTYDNYFRLLNALEVLKIDVTKLKAEQSPDPQNTFLRYTLDDCTLDLLPNIKAPIKFKEAYLRRHSVGYDGFELSFIGIEDLIADKEATGRPKDLTDIDHLKRNYFSGS
ncbi:hypothetical protein [Dyadobacter frigoris]|uniref:Nucleotidyltransferase family protein n=1 Tax=Dyadobacter frigoris TaxID=2576211 RepID=A0A4U6DBF7_9BACT|nr:hypothetical protein [Dyadobacter frigoris]TKT94095.1 hypothetical protein FDK13_02475 [Dyadobacter frigoris]GLU50694.1 hypothetical protein Dfri01_01550 [Dyadobacter frigoris]